MDGMDAEGVTDAEHIAADAWFEAHAAAIAACYRSAAPSPEAQIKLTPSGHDPNNGQRMAA